MATDDQPTVPNTSIFVWITIGYASAVLIGATYLGFFGPGGTPIDPEEWGAVLSGVFSPLAFLWLVYASLSQRAELELQRKELAQNNQSQIDQFNAMTAQAEALSAQVELMKLQTDDQVRIRDQAATESYVWSQWYLNGLKLLHDELIDYTAHLMRDVMPPVNAMRAEELYRLDHLQGIVHAEAGLPKVHILPAETQEKVLDLLSHIARHRRFSDNYKYRARTKGMADLDDIKGFCGVTNALATKAYDVGVNAPRLLPTMPKSH